MSIVFNAADHSYKSIEVDDIEWISVTSLVSHFKKPFDAKKIAEKVSKKKKSKWYGIEPSIIQEIWQNEAERSTTLGTWYHNQRESDLCSLASIEREGTTVPVFTPSSLSGETKIAPNQKLEPGIYPEHMVYLKSAGICGQSDLVEVVNGKVNIIDYKTNKEIKRESYVDWEGKSEKMNPPVDGLDDCHFYHYALQLSIYMYIILKHNPKLKPGRIFIHHIIFEVEGEDKWGYPITKKDINGDPIVKEVIPIAIPYLIDEVLAIIHYLSDNRDKINLKKNVN
jgi:ATP-dependent exoDNAse (exonuclease V) beta subunit